MPQPMPHRPTAPGAAALPVIDYHQMRMRHARAALWAGVRRWGVYLAVALGVLMAASNAPLAVLLGLCAAAAAPLLQAANLAFQAAGTGQHGVVAAGLALVWVYGLVGALPLLLTRALWWPARWAEAEAALPLPHRQRRASDARMLAWLLCPGGLVLAVGLALLVGLPAQRMPLQGVLVQGALATLAGLAATLTSAALGWAWMQWLRRRADARAQRPRKAWHAAVALAPGPQPSLQRALAWWRALLVLPLLRAQPRSPARNTARFLLLLSLASPALAAGPMAQPQATGWWLAGLTLCALLSAAWLRTRLAADWHSLAQACRALPLPPQRLRRGLVGLALLPAALGTLVASVSLGLLGARPLPSLAYLCVLLLASLCEAAWPPPEASAQAARWLLAVAVLLALGSEVMA